MCKSSPECLQLAREADIMVARACDVYSFMLGNEYL